MKEQKCSGLFLPLAVGIQQKLADLLLKPFSKYTYCREMGGEVPNLCSRTPPPGHSVQLCFEHLSKRRTDTNHPDPGGRGWAEAEGERKNI